MKYKKLILPLMGVFIWFLLYVVLPKTDINSSKIVNTKAEPGSYKITEVYDGDTFSVDMDGRIEKVRLIGVDTPETHKPNSPVECYGVNASNFAKQELTGKTVRLEPDPTNQNRDRYQRLLRYAYTENGDLFNLRLIQEGYGFAYLSFPFTKAEEFRQAQTTARQANKGLWAGDCKIEDQNGRNKTNPI